MLNMQIILHFVWVFVHTTSLNPPHFIEVPVSRRVSGHVFVCEIYIYIYIYIYIQIIILSVYVPSTHAYTHVLRLSLDLPYEKR